jgi:hypothetical protein
VSQIATAQPSTGPGRRSPGGQPPGAGPGAGSSPAGSVRRSRTGDLATRAMEGTPGRLRIAAIVAVLACLAFALIGADAFRARGSALDQARADAAQLIRVQAIATSVVQADSLFTNGYLAYGLESNGQLAQYYAAMATASRSIAEASAANPADASDLATVNQALTQYTARVAAARANNGQGNQASTGYLRQAANLLRGTTPADGSPDMLPTLGNLIQANTQRVDDAYSTSDWATAWLVLAAVLAAAGLGVVQFWLARTTHRYLNVPLAGASVAVVLVLIAGALVMGSAQGRANQVRDGAYTATLALAKARIAAFTGKSAESISLIYLGTGGDYQGSEKTYQDSLGTARTQLTTVSQISGADAGMAELGGWDAQHSKIYTQAQTDWTTAVKQASAPDGALNASFKAVDTATASALTTQAAAVDDGLGGSHGLLVALGWITLVVGLVAAGAAWAGVSQRLEEYR